MSEQSMINLVKALVGAELTSADAVDVRDILPRGSVVTVSRSYGSGGLDFARTLANKLGVRCFDRELLDAVASDAKVPRYLMERLDEQTASTWDDWTHSLITGKPAAKDDYRRHLINVVLGVARAGGVIVGRGAHLILDEKHVFRVRIVASPERCAKEIATRKNLSMEAARKEVERVNRERTDFIRTHFKAAWDDSSRYDIVLNSDRLDKEAMIEIVLQTMEHAGFVVKKNE
ncbi:MAG: hypothetical protein PWP23_1866 [Candidatus Sumerlaeota bacterium]|nr:hypothetical protein [Candidatus Sumerlaeota bacterium]